MSRIAIDYNKLLELAEACRITRHGSRWIDALQLIEAISNETLYVSAATPNCVAEIIANGEKCLKQGKRYAPTLDDLAAMLGVSRQTLHKWRDAEVITLQKLKHPTGKKLKGRVVRKSQYDLKEIIKALKVYKTETENKG